MTTTYSDFWQDVLTHFMDNWSQTPIAPSNISYDPQDPDNLDGSGNVQPYVKFQPQHGQATKQELGRNGRVDRPGVLFLGVNIPTGIGENPAMEIVDGLIDLFEGTHIAGAYFEPPAVNNNGRSDDGAWHETNVNFPFTIED